MFLAYGVSQFKTLNQIYDLKSVQTPYILNSNISSKYELVSLPKDVKNGLLVHIHFESNNACEYIKSDIGDYVNHYNGTTNITLDINCYGEDLYARGPTLYDVVENPNK